MKNYLKLSVITLLTTLGFSQSNIGGSPYTLNNYIEFDTPRLSMQSFDVEMMHREDALVHSGKMRYGKIFNVDLSSEEHGIWQTLEDGSVLWKFIIESNNAYALSVSFSEFNLPEESVLYIYNPEY